MQTTSENDNIRRLETTKSLSRQEVRTSSEDLQGDRPSVVRKVAAALRANGWKPSA